MPRTQRPVPEFKLRKLNGKPNYYVCWSEDRRSKRISTGTEDKVRAQQFLADFIAGWHAPPAREVLTVNDVIDFYLERKRADYGKGKRGKQVFGNIETSLKPIREFFGLRNPETLSRMDSRNFIEQRRGDGLANGTIRKQLVMFTAALNYAKAEDWLEKVPNLEKPPESPPKDVWMTPDQVRRFLLQCDKPHVKLFSLLALHTLSRKAAILDLKWSQIDFDQGIIDFNPPERPQNRKRRVAVKMNGVLREALRQAWEFALTEYVIEYNGKRVFDNKNAFQKAAKRAGMPWVTPHILRHTGATLLAQQGVPFWQIAGIMGDSMATVEKHYAKHHPDYMKEAIDTLEELYT